MKYVYCLFDPRNQLPFYVGMGRGKRCFSHLKETKDNTQNIRKYYKIQSIREDGFEPIVEIIKSNLSKQEACDFEKELISRYGRKDIDENGILMNIAPGGEGNSDGMKGKNHTKETILKIKEARNNQEPHEFTDSERELISIKVKEHHANMLDDQKLEIAEKISKTLTGKKYRKGVLVSPEETSRKRKEKMIGKKLHPVTRKWISKDEYDDFLKSNLISNLSRIKTLLSY